ncbi:hypothetical protein Tco_0307802 [Tanacetum coccineum]
MEMEEETNEGRGRMNYTGRETSIWRKNTEMTDAPCTNQSTSLIDVSTETPLSFAATLPPPTIPLITHLQQTPIPTPITIPSSSLQDLLKFGSLFGFDHRLKTLETDFLEFKQKNQFAAVVSSIPSIVDTYLANKMHEAFKIVVQLQSDRLRDEAQAENANFINKLDDNIKKIIKDQVKEQVKAQTSQAVAANLSELELKKILIDKMESNKSIHRSDEQKNLYKALVYTYESDKLILDTYEDTVSFKRRQDDEDKDEEPSAGSNQGSKRRRAGKEPESTSAPKEKTSKRTGKSTEGAKSHHKSASEFAQAEEPMHTAKDLEEPTHQKFETGVTKDQPNEETSQLPDWFQKLAKPPTPDRDWNKTFHAIYGPRSNIRADERIMQESGGMNLNIFEEVYKATTDQLDWNKPRVTRTKAADYGNIHMIEIGSLKQMSDRIRLEMSHSQIRTFDVHKASNLKAVSKNYRLRIQDIEYMLLLLVQGKLTNLTVEERLAFNVSLRMFTRSVVIQRRVEDLQLGVKSYQKKLNLTKPDTYRSDLKRREAYSAYSQS